MLTAHGDSHGRRAQPARRGDGKRKEQILRAAGEVFHEKGYPAASLDEIAGRLGMRKSSLYYYVSAKEDLLYELLIAEYEGAAGRLREAMANGDGIACIERFIDLTIGHQIEASNYRVSWSEVDTLSLERRTELYGISQHLVDQLERIIAKGILEGEFRTDVSLRVVVHSLLMVLSAVDAHYERATATDWCVSLFRAGLLPAIADR